MLRFLPAPLARLPLLALAGPLLAVGAAAAPLAAPGECAKARDLVIRQAPLAGSARRSAADTAAESVSGGAARHFRAADVAAPVGVATATRADWAGLATPQARTFRGPGPCDSPGSGCRDVSVPPTSARVGASPDPRPRPAPRVRAKGRRGPKCD